MGLHMKLETFSDEDKQAQMLQLLQFGTVMVFVDSRNEGVIVPDHLKDDYQLRLNFDYAFEIGDFRVLPDRLEASLSFNKKDFFCIIPFDAIYLMVNHYIQRGSLFVMSVPTEMLEVFANVNAAEETIEKPQLKPIAGQAEEKNEDGEDSSPPQKTPRKRGHLRVVK